MSVGHGAARLPLPLLGAFLIAVVGCSSPTDAAKFSGDDAVSISMFLEGVPVSRQASIGMLPANTLHFSARLNDAAGRAISGLHPTIVSRTPAAITIDSTGLMRVVGRGQSWLVAGYNAPRGLLADSVTVLVVCTTEARPGIQLTVTDSATGSAAAITSLSISARSGVYRDSVFYASLPSGTGAFGQAVAYERPGTWDVRVTADGFRSWAALGVPVTADLCHVITVPIPVRLQRP